MFDIAFHIFSWNKVLYPGSSEISLYDNAAVLERRKDAPLSTDGEYESAEE